MLCLGNPNDADYQTNEYQKLLRLLSVLASEELRAREKLHILEQEYHIATTRDLEGRVNTMCNWSEGVIERITRKVTEQVTQQVTDAKDISSVENVMASLNISAERACEILKIKYEDYLAAKNR